MRLAPHFTAAAELANLTMSNFILADRKPVYFLPPAGRFLAHASPLTRFVVEVIDGLGGISLHCGGQLVEILSPTGCQPTQPLIC